MALSNTPTDNEGPPNKKSGTDETVAAKEDIGVHYEPAGWVPFDHFDGAIKAMGDK